MSHTCRCIFPSNSYTYLAPLSAEITSTEASFARDDPTCRNQSINLWMKIDMYKTPKYILWLVINKIMSLYHNIWRPLKQYLYPVNTTSKVSYLHLVNRCIWSQTFRFHSLAKSHNRPGIDRKYSPHPQGPSVPALAADWQCKSKLQMHPRSQWEECEN